MVIGVLPMAGTGSRLGLPFPKALAPTILRDGSLRPLYHHAWARLCAVTTNVVFVVPAEPDPCFDRLPGTVLRKTERGELPSSIAIAAAILPPDEIVAVALPDAIWFPYDGMAQVVGELERSGRDAVLGLFTGSSHLLDAVHHDGSRVTRIARHEDPPAPVHQVTGWGCFAARAGALARVTDDEPLGPQLARLDTGYVPLGASYVDLGTPERYAAFHDLRVWA